MNFNCRTKVNYLKGAFRFGFGLELDQLAEIGIGFAVDEVIIGASRNIKHWSIEKLFTLGPLHFLLPSHLHHFPMRIGVLGKHKSRAIRGSVLGHKSTRLKPNSACVTQCFGPQWPSPPLRGLVGSAMQTPPSVGNRALLLPVNFHWFLPGLERVISFGCLGSRR